MKGTVLVLTLVTLVACTNSPLASTSPAVNFPSPTAGGTASPAPAPLTCGSRIPAGANLALVTLPDRIGVSIRDISDLSNPISRCLIDGTSATYPRFKDSNHVSYIVENATGNGALYVADLLTRRTSLVRAWSDGAFMYWVYAWSPDGKTLSYLSSDSGGVAWHLLSAAGDVTLSRFGPIPGRGVDPEIRRWDDRLLCRRTVRCA